MTQRGNGFIIFELIAVSKSCEGLNWADVASKCLREARRNVGLDAGNYFDGIGNMWRVL